MPAAAGLHELDLRETALGEHPPEIVGAVVEDRHVAHALVAKLANWPLEPVPSREAGDDRPVLGADLAHTAQERLGVREIIEEAETEDDELVVADCDLDATAFGKQTIFDFERYRRPEMYTRITSQRGVVEPEAREP